MKGGYSAQRPLGERVAVIEEKIDNLETDTGKILIDIGSINKKIEDFLNAQAARKMFWRGVYAFGGSACTAIGFLINAWLGR